MAAGTPVVATPTATAGLQSVAGRDLLVGADAESFAAQVVRLLEDRPLRQRLAQNALRLVQNVYAWERTVESLEQAYERALSAHELVMTPPRASVALET
jgi:glycosyltransferase involved in cell wall biosynthesis